MRLEWWHIGGLCAGLLQAVFLLLNQHFRIPARILMLWRGFGVAAVALPASFLIGGVPQHPFFYLLILLNGLMIGMADRWVFHHVLHLGAGTVSRLMVLSLPLAFVLWQVLHPSSTLDLFDKQLGWLIPIALLGTMASVYMLRRDAVSGKALMILLPNIVLYTVIDMVNKTSFFYASGLAAYFMYGGVTSLVAGLLNLAWKDEGGEPLRVADLITPNVWRGGISIVAAVIVFMLLKTSSFASTPNPAFPSALILTGPIWVLLWHRWRKIPDDANILAGLGCLLSALLLVLATI